MGYMQRSIWVLIVLLVPRMSFSSSLVKARRKSASKPVKDNIARTHSLEPLSILTEPLDDILDTLSS